MKRWRIGPWGSYSASAWRLGSFGASAGYYYTSFRELRFLPEFVKRAALLDSTMKHKSFRQKLAQYELDENNPDFRGVRLRRKLSADFGLSRTEGDAIDWLFGELSSHAHGSSEELGGLERSQSMVPAYKRKHMLNVVKYASEVADMFVLFFYKLGKISRRIFKVPPSMLQYFPLSSEYLR